jgi:transcriptional regulator GlxA family with amidase domain
MAMQIAFPLYKPFTALDLVGGYQVFAAWPDSTLVLVAETMEPIWDDRKAMVFTPDATFTDVPSPDVVMVPGSAQPFASLADAPLLDWLRAVEPGAEWMTSVCTGSGLLGAAGLLEGRRAATHWSYREVLAGMGVDVAVERYVFDGKFVTGGGVTAGIDMALGLTARQFDEEFARIVQLTMEYDPLPPFSGGSKETSPPDIIDGALRLLAGDVDVGAKG